MATNISSEQTIQDNTIQLLESMGYTYIPSEENRILRDNKLGEVVFKDILRQQLQKLNSYTYKGESYQFSPKSIDNAIKSLDEPLSEGMMIANARVSDQLVLGNSYEERLSDGTKKSFSLKYIDFDNIENNVFHCTQEFSVTKAVQNSKERTRRPDIVLFVNGIPFAVVELKKSSVGTAQGISQMIRNQERNQIPHLFKYIQITLAGNNHNPKYATAGTPLKFYATWEEDVQEQLLSLKKPDSTSVFKSRTPSKLDSTIFSLFNKKRTLELIRDFILFDANVKKIARYQQYFAIKDTMASIRQKDSNGIRKGGLIWHTQGSGKSLTMVMLAKKLINEIPGSKIVIVTDRKDLDKQIHDTFNKSEIEAKKAKSGKDLIELLQNNKAVAITTVINKFKTVQNENVVIDNPDLFIMVDESHRTQGGDLHKAMRKTFPKSCYIGFTGTPLLKSEKSTFKKFGKLLHKYTIDQAVKDKAVLPLLYEGRMVDQWINDEEGMNKKFERISRNLNDEQKKDLQVKWARFQKVASSERRLEAIVLDINEHFKNNVKGTGFKAMLATSSKYEAIKYHQLFEEEGDIKTAFIISPPDQREGYDSVDNKNKEFIAHAWEEIIKQYGDEETYNNKIKDEFVEGDEIDLLIVVDKLLTGFDAPRAAVLYIDKDLKDHNLLQAIARVNRLYEGKDFGYIIDYRGLLGDLDKALSDYSSLKGFDEDDIKGAVIAVEEEIARIKTFYSYLEEMFKDIKNREDQEEYELLLGDPEKRKEFYSYLKFFSKALKLALFSEKTDEVLSPAEIQNYKKKLKFYIELRKSVQLRYYEKIDFGNYEQQMQKMLDTYISAKEPAQITELVDIFDPDFESKVSDKDSKKRKRSANALADAILSAATATSTEKGDQNPHFYKKIAEQIEEILKAYKEGRISEGEKLEEAKRIREALMKENELVKQNYPEIIRESPLSCALYDNLKDTMESLEGLGKDDLLSVVQKINDLFLEIYKRPDWVDNKDARNEIEGEIEDLLWDIEDKFGEIEDRDTLLKTIMNIGISHYK